MIVSKKEAGGNQKQVEKINRFSWEYFSNQLYALELTKINFSREFIFPASPRANKKTRSRFTRQIGSANLIAEEKDEV